MTEWLFIFGRFVPLSLAVAGSGLATPPSSCLIYHRGHLGRYCGCVVTVQDQNWTYILMLFVSCDLPHFTVLRIPATSLSHWYRQFKDVTQWKIQRMDVVTPAGHLVKQQGTEPGCHHKHLAGSFIWMTCNTVSLYFYIFIITTNLLQRGQRDKSTAECRPRCGHESSSPSYKTVQIQYRRHVIK